MPSGIFDDIVSGEPKSTGLFDDLFSESPEESQLRDLLPGALNRAQDRAALPPVPEWTGNLRETLGVDTLPFLPKQLSADELPRGPVLPPPPSMTGPVPFTPDMALSPVGEKPNGAEIQSLPIEERARRIHSYYDNLKQLRGGPGQEQDYQGIEAAKQKALKDAGVSVISFAPPQITPEDFRTAVSVAHSFPFVPEDKPPDTSTTAGRIIEGAKQGLSQAGAGLVNFFATPEGMATLGVGAIPGMSRAVGAYFTAEMAKQLPEQYKELVAAWKKGDTQGVSAAATKGLANLYFVGKGGQHTIGEKGLTIARERLLEAFRKKTGAPTEAPAVPTPESLGAQPAAKAGPLTAEETARLNELDTKVNGTWTMGENGRPVREQNAKVIGPEADEFAALQERMDKHGVEPQPDRPTAAESVKAPEQPAPVDKPGTGNVQEQSDPTGAKFVEKPSKTGRVRRVWTQTKRGLRIGDAYDEGMAEEIVSHKPRHTEGMPEEFQVTTVDEIHSPNEISTASRDMTPAEIVAKKEKLRRDNEIRKEAGLPEEPIPEPVKTVEASAPAKDLPAEDAGDMSMFKEAPKLQLTPVIRSGGKLHRGMGHDDIKLSRSKDLMQAGDIEGAMKLLEDSSNDENKGFVDEANPDKFLTRKEAQKLFSEATDETKFYKEHGLSSEDLHSRQMLGHVEEAISKAKEREAKAAKAPEESKLPEPTEDQVKRGATPIEIEMPDGTKRKAEMNGYYDLREVGGDVSMSVGYQLPDGSWTHGNLPEGAKVTKGKPPSFEEWKASKTKTAAGEKTTLPEAPKTDLFPEAKPDAPKLTQLRSEIVKAEAELKDASDAANGENVRSDSPLHDVVDEAQARVDKLREEARALEKAAIGNVPGGTKSTTPTLLEFAKSKVSKATAKKLTKESQVESYRAQWEKEYPQPKTEPPTTTPLNPESPAFSGGVNPEDINSAASVLGISPPGTATFKAAWDWVKGIPNNARVLMAQLAGKAAPRTSTASEASGNALVHYASAKIAAPQVAKSAATEVLGEHHKDPAFGAKLGAVLVEDRLRAIRNAFQQAGNTADASAVESVIGKPWSPLATEADFQAALADPAIMAAIERHKAVVQPMAESAHEQAGGTLAGPGANTGAFVNLKAIAESIPEIPAGGGGRGNLENPLRRISRFFKQAKGTAAQYEVDYRTLAQRMVEGNFEESAKRSMYDQLVSDGLAQILDPGEKPADIGGHKPVKFTIERKGVPAGEGRARTYIQNLWVSREVAPELRQALNTDGAVGQAGMTAAANLINRIQLAGPTDAVWHTANMLGSIAGSQGGKGILTDLARKLPGVNIADAIGRVTASGIKVLRDSPEIQKQLAELSTIGAGRGEHPANALGRFVQFVDKAGRLVRDDMFKNLVERGLVENTEAARRDWVNQMGQYNGRLMGQFQRFFKEAGFSPFIVAGRNFNRMAMRRLTMNPGVKASSPAAAVQMRAVEALGTIATLYAIPAFFNYVLSGTPSGPTGTKVGQINAGKKDKDGNWIVVDPAQWTGLRRGMRISGLEAVTEGIRRGQSTGKITQKAAHDILGGIAHPWTGPAVTAGSVATTGYDPRFYKESVNPADYGENVKAALQQLNPVANAIIKSREKDDPTVGGAVKQLSKSLGGAFGVKGARPISIRETVQNAAQNFVEKNKLAPDKEWDLAPTDKAHFLKLYRAVDAGQTKEAAALMEKLREDRTDTLIWKDLLKHRDAPMTGSKKNEAIWLRTLKPDEKADYFKARDEQKAQFQKMAEIWRARPDRKGEMERTRRIRELVNP